MPPISLDFRRRSSTTSSPGCRWVPRIRGMARWSDQIKLLIGKPSFISRLDWWSLKPVAAPAVPDVQQNEWPRNDVDRFILARLESEGLQSGPRSRSSDALAASEFRVDRIASGTRLVEPVSKPTTLRRPTTICVRRCSTVRTSASAGRGTGWMWSTIPIRTATNGTCRPRMRGVIATI